MKTIPLTLIIFSFITPSIFIIRNVFYWRLWKYRHEIEISSQFSAIFPKGFKKMMNPIKPTGVIINNEILFIIKNVNFCSNLLTASLFLCIFLSLVELIFR
jgi:hypothetical protein